MTESVPENRLRKIGGAPGMAGAEAADAAVEAGGAATVSPTPSIVDPTLQCVTGVRDTACGINFVLQV